MGRSITESLSASVTSTPPIGTLSDVFSEGLDYSLTKKALSKIAYPALAAKYPNNINYESTVMTVSSFLYSDIAYGNGRYVAVGASAVNTTTTIAYISSDNSTWTPITLPVSLMYTFIAYLNGMFIAGGTGTGGATTTQYVTSPDGVTWTARTFPINAVYYDIEYGAGLFVVPVYLNASVLTSPDGITWTQRTSGVTSASNWKTIGYSGSLFVIAAVNSTDYLTSPDGVTWTARTLPSSTGTSPCLIYGNNIFVLVYGSVAFLTSPDGLTWTQRTTGIALAMGPRTGIYANNIFACLAYSSSLYINFSLDGIVWEPKATGGTNDYWYGMTYNPSTFLFNIVAGGNSAASTQMIKFWKSGPADTAVYISGTAGKYVRIT